VDVVAELRAPCEPARLFAEVERLDTYPDWLDIVPRAVEATAHPADPGPAWMVDLRGRLGPLARSKRLRMVRVRHDPPTSVRFERMEHDGRQHSDWILAADVSADDGGSMLSMRLHYSGTLFGPVLERMLADEIRSSRPRLLARLQ
jgi:hypothetical protein